MLEARIEKHFIDSADLKYQAAQVLAKPIADAVQALTACVTSGGKVLVCGNGGCAAMAQQFASEFIGRFERERPELAALALTADSAVLSALGNDYVWRDVYARQLRALGAHGDVLIALSASGQSANIVAAVEAAHERDMIVIALTGLAGQARDGGKDMVPGGALGAMLRETDIHICVPHSRAPRVHEVHGLVLHCLCDGVDVSLLGEQESE
jgi:D-sedoheptulose 7-phosphate isomerase